MNEKITILHTSDIHGYILPINYTNNQPENIGLAKIASEMKTYKKDNLILIDTGDTLQGSPMMYVHHKYLENSFQPMAKVLNYLSYDYYIPGNHDFNYGKAYLKNFTNNLNATTLCANIMTSENKLYFGKSFDIYTTKQGVKIAIIGLTTEYIPNWEQASHIKDISFNSVIETLRKTLLEIKLCNPDAILVAYHGGFEKDLDSHKLIIKDTKENVGSAILEEFPEIDVLLTGHQHRQIIRKINNTIISQPSKNGEGFSTIELEFQKNDSWQLISSNFSFRNSLDFLPDQNIIDMVSSEEKLTQEKLNQVIGFIENKALLINNQFEARLNKHPIVTLINKIQLEVSDAMISAMSLANESTGFKQKITVRDVLSTYPFANTLTVVQISGDKLKVALEENAKYFTIKDNQIAISEEFSTPKKQHYNYDMFDGIEYTIKVSNPIGQRITSLTRKGKAIKPTDSFSLVLNNYRATGGGDFEIFRNLDIVSEIPKDFSVIIIEYIQKTKTISPTNTNNIKVIK
ncbi:MAG: bifunctional UDP-sugar hydrolase/5'-nucleotidase [Tenericutes bacterium]|jgi:2',3'-cyclic-nucleotide 2'-phosphodiesterase/3'-nucleotidase|nr:bifunctional UDP-sugar hydrolase/5'-nucleotidase [Mycoplasmatota bacterium]